MFQIYWPPLPGQTEECFRKGKDPRVSLTHVCSALSWGGSPCGPGLCHVTSWEMDLGGGHRPVNARAEQGIIPVHEGN